MGLIRLHSLPSPPHQSQIPNFQSPLEHRYREETRIIVIVRLLILVGRCQGRVLGGIQSEVGVNHATDESPSLKTPNSPLGDFGEIKLVVRMLLQQVIPTYSA